MGRIVAEGSDRVAARAPAPEAARPRYAERRRAAKTRRRQLAGRAMVLVAAIAVPTVAAQGQWNELGHDFGQAFGLAPAATEAVPMPFEIAGQSFPGSAFYYVEDAPRLAFDVAQLRRTGGGVETLTFAESHDPGAAARAFQSAGSGLDKARALQCLSMAVYYEAASESHNGQRAVAQVVLNRVAHPAYPSSVCGVVFQGSERRTGCQFTFTCDGSLARKPSRGGWARAQSVALAALAGEVFAPVGTATHYHTHAVNPYWAASLDLIGSIGAHRFYRWQGSAGRVAAFSEDYSGSEPLAAPAPRSFDRSEPSARAAAPPPPNSALGFGKVPDVRVGAVEARAKPAPVSDNLPQAGDVKPEYARSGRWIRQPG